jgi:hypothetical protein
MRYAGNIRITPTGLAAGAALMRCICKGSPILTTLLNTRPPLRQCSSLRSTLASFGA